MRILLNGVSNDFESTSSDVLTESSDSEFFSEKDIKDSGNQISQQWEAIERTLYQETGEQVTDPELLKECKLWRESFPHFRVKGTKINVEKLENEIRKGEREERGEGGKGDTDKGIQTLSNHFNLLKINEKRESIKNKVVGELVERLIAKFNNNNNNNNNKGSCEVKSNLDKDSLGSGFQLSEKRDTLLSGKISPSEKSIGKVPEFLKSDEKLSGMREEMLNDERESYFERGKLLRNLENLHKVETNSGVTRDQMEKSFYQIFDDWEKEIDDEVNRKKPQTKNSPLTQRDDSDYPKAGNPKSNLNRPEKPNSRRLKPNKMAPPSDSLSRLTKPFEMTKKIDKKYEGLLDKILERNVNEPIRNLRANSSRRGIKGFHETFEEVTFGSVFDEPLKHDKNFPRINKFNNHWLERGEIHSNYNLGESDFSQRSTNSTRASTNKSALASNNHVEKLTQFGMDEKFLEELRQEMILSYKRPAKRSGVIENISLRRPKPHFSLPTEQTGKSHKSSSCGDLPKKSKKVKSTKPGLETLKTTKSTNLNNSKVKKSNSNQNGLLPPIESGIICTELTGRPKIGFKNPPKR